MATALAPRPSPAAIEAVLVTGDLSSLTESQRLAHYQNVCQSLGLNPLTQPFDYIKLNGRLVLYAKRDAAEQLRKLHAVSITDMRTETLDGVYVVTVKAQDKTGRTDMSTGAVATGTLKGEALANAFLKAETKAKRRVTLSICGLGMLDETEVESVRPDPPPLVIEATPERPPAPEGYVYVERMDNRSHKNFQWADVVLSTGEVVVASRQLVALLEQIAQEKVPVKLTTRTTAKGKIEVVTAARWPPPALAEPLTDRKIPFS